MWDLRGYGLSAILAGMVEKNESTARAKRPWVQSQKPRPSNTEGRGTRNSTTKTGPRAQTNGMICWQRPMGLSLARMMRFSFSLCGLAAIVVFSAAVVRSSAQAGASSNTEQHGVVLAKLIPPLYPPLAKQARIAGDVELAVGVRQDGSVESAVVVSGHPLLRQAALDSVKRSQFECQSCNEAVTSQRILFSFQPGPTKYCSETPTTPRTERQESSYPQVIHSANHVTLIDQPVGTCDPAVTITRQKVRSLKCLYLWRCGLR